MARSWRRIPALVALLVLLTGCVGGGPSNNPFVQKGATQASPSGAFTAELQETTEKGFTEYRPIITDASGNAVWQSETAFVERYFPGVAWEKDTDVLWILSSDVGNSRVEQTGSSWEQTFGSDGMPEFLAEWANR